MRSEKYSDTAVLFRHVQLEISQVRGTTCAMSNMSAISAHVLWTLRWMPSLFKRTSAPKPG
uniref:Uncharacterized protein n=1 Tax=Anguilla anguilla TaxID=7936 RepID=A0A0E9V3E2_ANGAN